MSMNYLKLPLNFLSIVKGNNKQRCTLEESIAQSIMMLITTRYGEISGKPGYGSVIWELEFNQLVKIYEWEEAVKKSLEECIASFEKRLNNVAVEVKLTEIGNHVSATNHTEVRRKADIYVKGDIVYAGAPFYFNTVVYISPLSQ